MTANLTNQELHQARLLPVLEPLSGATATILAPIEPFPNEYLYLDVDDEGTRFVAHLVAEFGSGTCPPSKPSIALFDRIPERKHHPDKTPDKWILGGTDYSALVIFHAWPSAQLRFVTDEAETLFRYLLLRFLHQRKNASVIANYKVNQVAPEMPSDFRDHPEMPLVPYQKVGVLAAMETDFAEFMEQGTGKTPLGVNLVCNEAVRKIMGKYGKPEMYLCIIVCPNQVRLNWENEFRRFSTVPGKVTVIRGGELTRNKLLIEAIRPESDCVFSVVVIGVDSVERTWDMLSRVSWDRAIIDESHKIKNPRTNRFKIAKQLRECCRWRLIMTGTPMGNSMNNLWAQLEFLGPGLSGFQSYENFRKFYGQYKKEMSGHGVERLIGLKNVPLIQERLARLAMTVTKKEANLNLPDLTEDITEISMTKQQAEWYCRLRDQLALEIKANENEASRGGKRLTAEHILTKLLRLSQITSGFVVWDKEIDEITGEPIDARRIEEIPGGNPKIDQTIAMLIDPERNPKAKTIIWCIWVQDIKMLSAALTARGLKHGCYYGSTKQDEREAIVNKFNNKHPSGETLDVIIANARTAGEGLNLLGYDYEKEFGPGNDTYCDLEIFFSEGWSRIDRVQAMARAYRRGTKRNVRVTTMVCPGTIDQEIYERIASHNATALSVADVQDILKRVLSSDTEFETGEAPKKVFALVGADSDEDDEDDED